MTDRTKVRSRTRGDAERGPLPDPATDEFASIVAGYAWRDGLTANAIVKKLNLPSQPRHLMQVKRALKRAHSRMLQLNPLPQETLANALSAVVNANSRRKTRFYVVEDSWGPSFAAVYAKAAELALQLITDSVRTAGQVVVCNAGGRTISGMVKALQRNPPILDESDERAHQIAQDLIFVAANAAYHADEFHHSANFLSVTMAELFGARHWALPRVINTDLRKMHQELVDKSALLICSAGTLEKGLLSKYFVEHDWQIPKEAIGDLAFNFLDASGNTVHPPSVEARAFLQDVNPTLDAARVMHIASNSRVLLILDANEPEEKRQVGAAALRRAYATDVVLGARLARAILREYRTRSV
jgi:hypothetical protein